MSGIQYITDENGNKTAVVIDLKKHLKLWEDISDQLVAGSDLQLPDAPEQSDADGRV